MLTLHHRFGLQYLPFPSVAQIQADAATAAWDGRQRSLKHRQAGTCPLVHKLAKHAPFTSESFARNDRIAAGRLPPADSSWCRCVLNGAAMGGRSKRPGLPRPPTQRERRPQPTRSRPRSRRAQASCLCIRLPESDLQLSAVGTGSAPALPRAGEGVGAIPLGASVTPQITLFVSWRFVCRAAPGANHRAGQRADGARCRARTNADEATRNR